MIIGLNHHYRLVQCIYLRSEATLNGQTSHYHKVKETLQVSVNTLTSRHIHSPSVTIFPPGKKTLRTECKSFPRITMVTFVASA